MFPPIAMQGQFVESDDMNELIPPMKRLPGTEVGYMWYICFHAFPTSRFDHLQFAKTLAETRYTVFSCESLSCVSLVLPDH